MLTVFGSINLDIAIRVPRLPGAGETVLGSEASLSPGGKGANQAHAARLAGVPTRMVGAVGRDGFADDSLKGLRAAGVNVAGVRVLEGMPTGLATIAVTHDGENSIIVAPGANDGVRAHWVTAHALQTTRVLLLQMEVPAAESIALAARGKAAGCLVILNAAPMVQPGAIGPDHIDWLIVNETELAQLCAVHGLAAMDAVSQAEGLAQRWQRQVVVTLGARGAHAAMPDASSFSSPGLPIEAVDTTGAGDTFTGAFAASLCEGMAVRDALRFAVVAAGLACRRAGAQQAQPSRSEIEETLIHHRNRGSRA